MKATIKIKRLASIALPEVIDKGEWIDLRAARSITVGEEQPVTYIPLGIAVALPPGYEAVIAPRSSTGKQFGIWCTNSFGIVDNSYRGNGDEWHFPCTTLGCERANIFRGDRICQFRIRLSQKATMWQRLKWIFTNGVKIEEVETLDGSDRGGFGTTGKE